MTDRARSDHGVVTLTNADLPSAKHDGSSGEAGSPGPRAGNAQRRVFSNAYKLRIVEEYDGLSEHGARGGLLRREGLYQSHVEKWRRARERGALGTGPAAAGGSAGPGRGQGRAILSENRRLRQENERLTAELERTRAVLEIVGKAHALLETISGSAEKATPSTR